MRGLWDRVSAASEMDRRNACEPVMEPPQARDPGSNPTDMGWPGGARGPVFGRVPGPGRVIARAPGERDECLCDRRDRSAGEKLGATPIDRTAVNVGTRLVAASPFGAGKAQRRLMPPGGDGASVVVRGRESRPHGEGRQRACSARLECEEVRR